MQPRVSSSRPKRLACIKYILANACALRSPRIAYAPVNYIGAVMARQNRRARVGVKDSPGVRHREIEETVLRAR